MKNSGKGLQDVIWFSLDTQHRLELVDARTMKEIPRKCYRKLRSHFDKTAKDKVFLSRSL